jgi:hypothetical protein
VRSVAGRRSRCCRWHEICGVLLVCASSSCRESPPSTARVTDLTRPSGSILGPEARPLPLEQVQTTLGRLEPIAGAWLHTGPQLRATFPHSCGDVAALKFRYRGATPQLVPLRSGQVRKQLGLKLRARDSCNVLYVMWRFETPPAVVVSAKRNPGTRHSECGNGGYHNLRPLWSTPIEAPDVESIHELAARIEAGVVEVWIDSKLVLRASVDQRLVPAQGEAGLRSDNVRFELHDFTSVVPRSAPASSLEPACAASAAVRD